MTTDEAINTALEGVAKYIPDELMQSVYAAVEKATDKLEATRRNERDSSIFVRNNKAEQKTSDPDVYTNLNDLLNVDQKSISEFSAILSGIYAKNKKYYTVLRDYEIMPILIPQINRVLMFLVNETLSPDIQNTHTFEMKYIGTGTGSDSIQRDLDRIRTEMDLDRTLQDVVTNRYKLGREYRLITDYQQTFDKMSQAIQQKMLNENIGIDQCDDIFNALRNKLTETITETTFVLPVRKATADNIDVSSTESIKCDNLNIVIERSPIVSCLESAQAEFYRRKYEKYSIDVMLNDSVTSIMNEATGIDKDYLTQFQSVIDAMNRKKLHRANVQRLDPARVFQLKLSGKIIGYFYITDLTNENYANPYTTQFGQSLKDRLMKSRNQSTPTTPDADGAEQAIAKILAEKIIKGFDPSIGINRVEDIDLMHDFIINNEIYKGNKKITFYYADDIIDLSRRDESLLINAVFFTKLYCMMLLNNIMTKVLRGRGRQIHTVRLGVSNAVRKYLNNAIIALNNPETSLGMIHGSFEQLLNPLNSACDIVLPVESESDERIINTDYIEGQNVDMDTEFLKFLLNCIVASFGLDSATIDATNGQLQFARTLSMESLQIANNVKNEQADLYPGWKAYCMKILSIMGSDETKAAVKNDMIEISFYEPKSLMVQNTLEEISNVKNYVDAIADLLPIFNGDNADQTNRNVFVYMMMKSMINVDWAVVENALRESKILSVEERLEEKIIELSAGYQEHEEDHDLGDSGSEDSDEFGDDSFDDTGETEEFSSDTNDEEESTEEPEEANTEEAEEENNEDEEDSSDLF